MLIPRYTQNYREKDYTAFVFPTEGRLLLAACNRSQGSPDSCAVLELYDTSPTGDPGKLQCMFTLPSRLSGRNFVKVYSGSAYRYNPSTFYARPEDRILTTFVEETSQQYGHQYRHITLVVVFISTLLHLSESRRFIGWQEWKQYAWVANHREANGLLESGAITSNSRIINFSLLPKQPGLVTLEVTAFRPSIIERPLYTSGSAPDNLRDGGARRLIDRKVSLDVQAKEGVEVSMTEDNIILIEVRYLPDNSFPISHAVTHSRIEGLTQAPK